MNRLRLVAPEGTERSAIRSGAGPGAALDVGNGLLPESGPKGRMGLRAPEMPSGGVTGSRVPNPGTGASVAQKQREPVGSDAWQKNVRGSIDKLLPKPEKPTLQKGPAKGGGGAVSGGGKWEKQGLPAAKRYLGVRYQWGGTNPKTGLDCSAYTQLVFRAMGIKIPRVSRDQAKVGQKVNGWANVRPGDLVFYQKPGKPVHHVGIYAGTVNGQRVMYNAPRKNTVVRIDKIALGQVSGVRRVI